MVPGVAESRLRRHGAGVHSARPHLLVCADGRRSEQNTPVISSAFQRCAAAAVLQRISGSAAVVLQRPDQRTPTNTHDPASRKPPHLLAQSPVFVPARPT